MDSVARALAYHERSKHHLQRYARSTGYLDWETQPDPFRTYEGAPVLELPLAAGKVSAPYDDLFRPNAVAAAPTSLETLASLFELSLGLSAWKQHGPARWALRCNPSSGNLHPTEGYVLAASVPGAAPGLYHYVSRDHTLERRCTLSAEDAIGLKAMLPTGALLVGLSSIHFRESWKYGERAFRYCQHDAGHAIAAIRFSAAALGHSAVLLDGLGDREVEALLGLSRDDAFEGLDPGFREHPDAVMLVAPGPVDHHVASAICAEIGRILHLATSGSWAGKANALGPSSVPWEAIDEAAEATRKGPSPLVFEPVDPLPEPESGSAEPLASVILRKRRSAVSLDGETTIGAETLYRMLDRLLPRPAVAPWDAIPWAPMIHPVLFLHRVRGLPPGLYALERSTEVHERLRAAMHPELSWTKPRGCPEHLRLFLLAESDFGQTAQIVSCHQDIAKDGALSLGMVADFSAPLRARGASFYRRLFWEAGVLGQVLYLESEADGVEPRPLRATGIGCYFDDVFHEVCGFKGDAFQSLYHFTLGGPVEDVRLAVSSPPYGHLKR